jgi:hypothetical protein
MTMLHLAGALHVRRLERVRHGQVVDALVVVEARVAFARVQAAC